MDRDLIGLASIHMHFENDTSTTFLYHVTNDQCVCVGSLLVESSDTVTYGERERR